MAHFILRLLISYKRICAPQEVAGIRADNHISKPLQVRLNLECSIHTIKTRA